MSTGEERAPGGAPHMSTEEFRRQGKRMIDLIADYWESLESRPVVSGVRPGEIAGSLPADAPEHAGPSDEAWDAIFEDVRGLVIPGLTHWQHPGFFAYFPANASGPGVLGELLSAGLGVQGMLWSTSPACTEVEMRVLDWMGAALGLPERFLFRAGGGGVIQGTASEAALAAMVAARHGARARGADPGRLVAYASTQTHSSIAKGAMVAGITDHADDHRRLRLVETDGQYRMRPDRLGAMLREDLHAGRIPFFVCATVGTTGSTAVDPVGEIAGAIEGAGASAWLHVDAAHAGAACVCPEFRWMLRGVERADSVCFNPHKWLLTNFDCNCFWTSRPADLTAAMSITPEYLRNLASDSGGVVDYRDWHVPLGRRFRSLKLWFVLRHYGVEGLRAHIRGHVRLAAMFEELVARDERFEVAAERTCNLVCFRLRPREGESPEKVDARNRELLARVNAGGRVFLTHTVLPGVDGAPARYVLRMAIGGVRTREDHVRGAWELVGEAVPA